jgi:hypothetical protein
MPKGIPKTVVEIDRKSETVQVQAAVDGLGELHLQEQSIVKPVPKDQKQIEENDEAFCKAITKHIIPDGGETCGQFYYKNGISGKRKEMLERIRDGKVNVSEISGMVPVIRQNYVSTALSKIFMNFSQGPKDYQ